MSKAPTAEGKKKSMTQCCCLSKDIILQRLSNTYCEINFPALQLLSQSGPQARVGSQNQREIIPGKKSVNALDRFQLHSIINSLDIAAVQNSFPYRLVTKTACTNSSTVNKSISHNFAFLYYSTWLSCNSIF